MADTVGNVSYATWNFQNLGFGNSSSAGNSGRTETFEEYEKRIAKERAERAKKAEDAKKELENYAEELRKIEAAQKQNPNFQSLQKAKNAKEKSDGTLVKKESMGDYKKLSTGKKITRALSNMWQGTFKMATDFIGMEKDKKSGEFKWNPLKCAINVGVTAGCIALCFAFPPAAPFIIGAGAVMAGVQAGYGTYKICTAKNTKEIDNGCQDLGAGLTGVALSLVGAKAAIKPLPKMSSVASVTETINGTARATAAAAKPKFSLSAMKSYFTKNEYAKGNRFTQGFKDLTINLPRAFAKSCRDFNASKNSIGLGKTLKNNFVSSLPKFGRTKFVLEKKAVHDNLMEEITSVDARIKEVENLINKNGAIRELQDEFAILKSLKMFLNNEYNEIMSASTRNNFAAILKNSKANEEFAQWSNMIKSIKKNGLIEVETEPGVKYNLRKSPEILKCLENLKQSSKNRANIIKNLCNTRRSTMRTLALSKKNAAEVNAYTEKNRTNTFMRIFDTTPKLTFGLAFQAFMKMTMLQFLPWEYVSKMNGGTSFITLQAIQSLASKGYYEDDMIPEIASMFGHYLWGDETLTAVVPTTNEQGQPVVDANGNVMTQKTALTKELKAQLEKENELLETQKAEIKNKIHELERIC